MVPIESFSSDKDCYEESINSNTNWSSPKDTKIDEYFEVDSLSVAATSEDCILLSVDVNVTDMRPESSSIGPLKGTSSRKRNIVVEKCSDVPTTLVVDIASNPSKRLRWINGVDQSNDENSCAKLETEASLILAKPNLKGRVDKVNAWLSHLDLQRNLSSKGNYNVIGRPKAFESSNWIHSKTNIARDVELVKKKISRKMKESQMRERQWRRLLHMQLEDKLNLEKEIEIKEADFVEGYKIELALFQKFHVLTKEVLNNSNSKHHRRLAELKRKHQVCLQDLETKQLETRQKFKEILRRN
ncbi:unnamed protein product [Trifolium pratense]|uniref:Uncharacterized protein n=1 Tax=Trifolium pratense TaxID=57577 RepID=A0ACB0KIX5_TRIPR|nr:unnamed protein product [Trifolium pratense]